MIYIMKKKSFFVLIFVIISVIILNALVINITNVNVEKNDEFTVIIDPGHGGEDGGAVGVNNIIEKDLNLLYAKDLKSYLEILGYNVIMTRDTDTAIYDEGAHTIREKKTSDLHNRLDMTKNIKNGIFISIHMNKFPQEKYFGSQVFYGGKNENSKLLGQIITDNFLKYINPQNNRPLKQVGKDIYIIYNCEIPSVLVECGFISNQKEAELLMTRNYREKMMYSLALSIKEYKERREVYNEN